PPPPTLFPYTTLFRSANVQIDIDRLKSAIKGLDVEPYLPAVAPGRVEHWLWNEHYPTEEAFLFAIADVMHEEYKAITDAGIVVRSEEHTSELQSLAYL